MTRTSTRPIVVTSLAGVLVLSLSGVAAKSQAPAAPRASDAQLATVKQYCAGCHSDRAKAGGVSFEGLTPEKIAALVVAYEPIWAIGTGRTATSADAQDVCAAIRGCVAEIAGSEAADEVRIQYGGSVKASNIAELIAQPDIDGALVGGASLDPDEFSHICKLGA